MIRCVHYSSASLTSINEDIETRVSVLEYNTVTGLLQHNE